GEDVGLVDDAQVLGVVQTAAGHALHHFGGHGGGVVVARHHAQQRVVVAAGEDELVIHARREPLGGEERLGRLVAGVGGGGSVRHARALQVGELLVRAIGLHVHLQGVTEAALVGAHDGERYGARQVD